VQLLDRANSSINFAAMGYTRSSLVAAVIRAFLRGVPIRFVGDARHVFGSVYGYVELDRYNIPYQVGNQNHIMHNKYFIIDDRLVVTGTGNLSGSEFDHNNNNWVVIDSPQVAADFTAEFEQKFSGRFGAAKTRIENGNRYHIGDTDMEVHFSPQEDTMGRMLQAVEAATDTIEFTIFAFTKDQMGALFVAKHQAFEQYNLCCDPSRADERDAAVAAECLAILICETPFRAKYVRGVIDQSQLHSNGPYHEVYRMLVNGLNVRIDGNDNSYQPGDYQAGGGRLHAKTILIDHRTDKPVILSGSFNWSSSATLSNDETLLVFESPRLAEQYADTFEEIWQIGKHMGQNWVGDAIGTAPGDVIFNEIMWDGYDGDCLHSTITGRLVPCNIDTDGDGVRDTANPVANQNEPVDNDEFIELLNTTDHTIDLSMWTIANGEDFAVGLYPGTVIGPYERMLIAGHNTEPYDDLTPQFRGGAYEAADFVMNTANDQRFLRLNLRNIDFKLRLIDPYSTQVDQVGNGGPPFVGGRQRESVTGTVENKTTTVIANASMERVHVDCSNQGADCRPVLDGSLPEAWKRSERGGDNRNVRVDFRDVVVATPSEINSIGDVFPAENRSFRSESGQRGGTPERDF
jgi:phosphatidylserine/phosphatidylglycerophosphate/cardiolipin synthase-like enzyme